jgi:hypothetical protein
MTTITVEIGKDKDLSALKEFIGRLGLNYQVDEREGVLYTEDVKNMLDKRYNDYLEGAVEMTSAEESQRKIKNLLAVKSK